MEMLNTGCFEYGPVIWSRLRSRFWNVKPVASVVINQLEPLSNVRGEVYLTPANALVRNTPIAPMASR